MSFASHQLMHVLLIFMAENFRKFNKLWFSFIPRTNLSPFTKDFRGAEQQNESIDQFFVTLPTAWFSLINIKFQNHRLLLFLLSFVHTRYGALL